MVSCNADHTAAYGDDPITAEASALFKEHFGPDAQVFLAFNGTGANVIGLQSLLRPFEAVICAAGAHIYTDECGAPERFLGSKLIPVATLDGKLTPELVDDAVRGVGDEHHVQPRVLSITQATEVGTCYRLDEIAALSRWAHDRSLYLHLDGARLANAATFLDAALGAFGPDSGVDVLSFGGTKNGAMGAEAVISFRAPDDPSLRYIRKQSMQLASKMRFVSAQFVALLSGGLWRANAERANAMARRLAEGVKSVANIAPTYPVEANSVFVAIPPSVTEALQRHYPFYVWDERSGVVRWMTSFDTTEEDVDTFVNLVGETMATYR
jgi:threonine aldolase